MTNDFRIIQELMALGLFKIFFLDYWWSIWTIGRTNYGEHH